jgi:hypothetical protein
MEVLPAPDGKVVVELPLLEPDAQQAAPEMMIDAVLGNLPEMIAEFDQGEGLAAGGDGNQGAVLEGEWGGRAGRGVMLVLGGGHGFTPGKTKGIRIQPQSRARLLHDQYQAQGQSLSSGKRQKAEEVNRRTGAAQAPAP